MEPVPRVGRVFFPLDKELALLPGNLAPRQQEHLAHLASWMPFAKASALLACLLGVQVGEETVRRLTEQAGRQVEEAQTQAATAPWQEETTEVASEARLAISADGAYVPLVKGEWAEVRTLAIGKIKGSPARRKKSETRTCDLSYFSRMSSAERFIALAEVETRRRKLVQAQQVCAVMDGAGWLQGLVDVHRPDAVRILDFPHAAEHISLLLQGLEQAGMRLPVELLPRLLHQLKHRGPHALLRLAARLPAHLAEAEGVREHLNYLQKRAAQMDYPHFRKQGWPIGSGSVESANKLVVEARLKGAGMHWQRNNVNPMLALRNGVCNERWGETWQIGQHHLWKQQQDRRTARAQHRRAHALAVSDPLLLTSPSLPPPQPAPPPLEPSIASSPPAPAATLPGSSRPSAHHPWKRGLACSPKKTFAKM
jgi:hypothetical protein